MSTPEFYANARAYDIAFGDRDFVDECNFLEFCWKEFGRFGSSESSGRSESSSGSNGSQPHKPSELDKPYELYKLLHPSPPSTNTHSFLELAAGPARHAREFAKRGWRAVALDLSQDMLEYAQEGAASEGIAIEAVCADMTDFTLNQPVALMANLMESLSHLTTNEQVIAHLRAVSKNLIPGGIFVIEMAHPETIWRDSLPNFWTSTHDDGTEIDILFGSKDDPYDWITQQWTVTTRLDIREPGQTPRVVESHNNHRWYLAQELRALIDLSGAFSETYWFGNMVLPPPQLDSGPDSDRMIIVLRK